MRTKFKDAGDLLGYAESVQRARDEALRAYTEANQEWLALGELIGRLTLPDDMRETPEAKGEWIIEVRPPGTTGITEYVWKGNFFTANRKLALRFTSEQAAADFAADLWKGWEPKVVPFEAPVEPEIKLGDRVLYDFRSKHCTNEPGTITKIESHHAYVDFDNKFLNDATQPARVSLLNLKPLPG